jgi:DNA-binding SARP family transcriptional activator
MDHEVHELTDREWVSNELRCFQREEISAIERVKKAEAYIAGANAELAAAKEALAWVRGRIAEFALQMKHLEEHGRFA